MSAAEEGINLASLFPEEPTTEPPATPTPAPAPTQEKSTVEIFADEISQYDNPQEAKRHFKAIAEKLNCSPQLGYKALKKVEKFKDHSPRPKTPTIKIPKAELEAPAEPTEEIPTYQNPADEFRPPFEQPAAPIYQPPSFTNPDVDAQQKKTLSRQATKAINNVLEIVGTKAGIAGEKGESFLDAEDSEDLGVVLPILLKKATGGTMTPETQENAVLFAFAGNLATKALKNRFQNQPQPTFKPKPTPSGQQQTMETLTAPKTEPPAVTPTNPAPAEPQPENNNLQSNAPKWARQLPRA